METIKQLCDLLSWNVAELQRQAGLSYPTAYRAYHGKDVQLRTKRDICSALSKALDRSIQVRDITWVLKK